MIGMVPRLSYPALISLSHFEYSKGIYDTADIAHLLGFDIKTCNLANQNAYKALRVFKTRRGIKDSIIPACAESDRGGIPKPTQLHPKISRI